MVVTIEHALELMAVIFADECPCIPGFTIQCIFVGQYILVQENVIGQLVVLALCQCSVGIAELCQISQLSTVVNQVWVIFRTLTLCKFGCDIAFPYVWEIGVTMEGSRYCNREVRHGKRPDTFGHIGQCKHFSRGVVDHFQSTAYQ